MKSASAAEAYQSMAWFLAHRETAISWLETKIGPDFSRVSREEVSTWLAELDSPQYEIRETARARLLEHRVVLKSQLEEALAESDSFERQLQLRRILSNAHTEASQLSYEERNQLIRSVFLLELLQGPRTQRLLEYLSSECPHEFIKVHAADVLARVQLPTTGT